MSAFVELIKKIGIFMIAAQAVIHFAPAQKYEKYIRMIVGVMILLLFLTPVYQILTKTTWEAPDWNALTENGLTESASELDMASNSVMYSVVEQMEKEIKSRLNREIEEENYHVVSVNVNMQTTENMDEYGGKQYELDSVRVVVRRTYSIGGEETQNNMDKIEKVQIQKIDVTLDEQNIRKKIDEAEAELTEKQEKEEALRRRFCSVLGMEEKYMEVSVYGTFDESSE
ncbi:MAG: stage III sporulation protein AF [Lachnospiraceae bacterium]|nr:stage III sporulation protein AF [Lachnospiraceae bacterium]